MWSVHHDPEHWDKPDLFNPGNTHTHTHTTPHLVRNIHLSKAHLNTPPSCLPTSPARFLDDRGQRVTPVCFLPFGAGPRVCVGESLARLELFLFLSSLLQRISFRLPAGAAPPNLQGRLGVVLQPRPFNVVVTPRGGWGCAARHD